MYRSLPERFDGFLYHGRFVCRRHSIGSGVLFFNESPTVIYIILVHIAFQVFQAVLIESRWSPVGVIESRLMLLSQTTLDVSAVTVSFTPPSLQPLSLNRVAAPGRSYPEFAIRIA